MAFQHWAMRSHQGRIAPSALADLYLQLSRLEQAGLPAQQALSLIESSDPGIQNKVRRFRGYFNKGFSIAEAGGRAGLFVNPDKALIKAGESGGKLGAVYQQLVTYYAEKARRLNKIKSKLYLPVFVLLLAMLLQPLPALVQQQIGAIDYLLAGVGRFVLVMFALFIAYRLPYWLCDGFLRVLGLANTVYRLQYGLPFVSGWFIKRQSFEFFRCLGLLLEAGMAIADALPMAVDVIKNPLLRQRFEPAMAEVGQGFPLAEALMKVDFIDRHALRLLNSGEHSGKLDETLLHYCRLEAERIALQDELLADWAPRLFYFAVAGWVAFSIIGGYQPTHIGF